MDWKQLLTEEIEYNYAVADQLMNLVDDGALGWKPSTGANWMTTGQVVEHITTACGTAFKGFITGDWGLPDGTDMSEMSPEEMVPPAEALPTAKSVAAARAALAADKKLALDTLAGVSEDDLHNKPAPAPWDPRPVGLGHRLLGMVGHLTSHKDQLYYYLKLQGKPVNTMTKWGMGG
jgi:hypothetical protein